MVPLSLAPTLPMALQLIKASPGQPASPRCKVMGCMHGVAPPRGAILQRKFREIPEVGSRGVGSAEKGNFSAEETPNGSGSAQGAREVSLEAHARGVTKSQTPKKFPEILASQGGVGGAQKNFGGSSFRGGPKRPKNFWGLLLQGGSVAPKGLSFGGPSSRGGSRAPGHNSGECSGMGGKGIIMEVGLPADGTQSPSHSSKGTATSSSWMHLPIACHSMHVPLPVPPPVCDSPSLPPQCI